MKTSTLLYLQFYRILFLFNIACTLLAVATVIFGFGFVNSGNLFIAKILGFAGAVLLHQYTAKDTYFYFRNAGCRMRKLITLAFVTDLLVFTAAVLLFNVITHAATNFKG